MFRRPTTFFGIISLYSLIVVVLVFFFLYRSSHWKEGVREHVRVQTEQYWWWIIGFTRYNGKPTETEQQCYDGTISRHNDYNLTDDIPNVVHFVWGPSGAATFPFILYLAIRAALISLKPKEVRVHYSIIDTASPWYLALKDNITLEYHEPASYLEPFADAGSYLWDIAHMADVLRLKVLEEQGGIYLDQDCFVLRPMDHLLAGNRDVLMGYEGGNRGGLTNAVILAKKGAPFITRWLGHYHQLDDRLWNYHSVQLPLRLLKEYPEEVCALAPSVFYWPLWNPPNIDYMHEPLTPAEAEDVRKILEKNDGALYDDQLVMHAWSHGARKYLQRMDPDVIMSEDTRFNLMMRPFLS